ncbi:MAG: radical SAM protein [Ruminococcaceae bacterium]|nr:radical SAM protein [Oscillospiraceae bacterium]
MYNKVYIEITNICNMNCSFCHGHSRAPRQMSMDEFALILERLKEQTKYIYYHLMGEPTTHPLLPEFIKLASKYGYKSIVTTNGTLLNKCGDSLLNAGVHKVNISLHSFENGTDCEHAQYMHHLIDFAKKAADNGVIAVFRMWNNGFDDGKNEKAITILKENISGEWVKNTRGIRIRDKIHIEWGERFEWPDLAAQIKGDKFYCYALKDQFGILVDGTVVPCCLDSDGVINLGNIYKSDIATILNSVRANKIADGFKCGVANENLCKKCGYAQRFV